MKTLDLSNIQEGVRKLGAVKAVFEHMESAYVEAMSNLIKGLVAGTTTPLALHGCVNSGSGSNYNISAGAIWHNGELFTIPALVGTAGGGQVPVLTLATANTQLAYTDNTNQNTLVTRTYAWQFGASGSGLGDYSGLGRLATIINNTLLDVDGQLSALETTINGSLALKAPLASPAFTGTPTVPNVSIAESNGKIANTNFVWGLVTDRINALINGAPGALDALNELAAALGNDPNFATTVTNSLATKVPNSRNVGTSGGLQGGGSLAADLTLSIANGGVDAAKLASDAVTTIKLINGAVTAAKIGDGEVTDVKLASKFLKNADNNQLLSKRISGNWNMDTDGGINVAHGLTLAKIVSVTGRILSNDGSTMVPLASMVQNNNSADRPQLAFGEIGSTHIILRRADSSFMDAAGYNNATYVLIVIYEP